MFYALFIVGSVRSGTSHDAGCKVRLLRPLALDHSTRRTYLHTDWSRVNNTTHPVMRHLVIGWDIYRQHYLDLSRVQQTNSRIHLS